MDLILVQILCFMAVLMLVVGIEKAVRKKTKSVKRSSSVNWLLRTFAAEISLIGSTVTPIVSNPKKINALKGQLLAANLSRELTPEDIIGAQFFTGSLALTLTTISIFIFSGKGGLAVGVGILLGVMGLMWPSIWLKRIATTRQDAIKKEIPYAIDLISVAISAGQDLGAAIRYFVDYGPVGPLKHEFSIMLQETSLGLSRIDAFREMAKRIQLEEFNAIVTSLVQSIRTGGNLINVLKIQSENIRRQRMHRAETQVAKSTSLMIIPVAVFIVPAVFIIILTPIGLRMFNTLQLAQ